MADDEQKRIQEEKERKKAEVRARLEAAAQAKKGGGKKGFMTPARKKKLRTLLRKKAAEELKKEQERKAEERKKTIQQRCGAPKHQEEGINEAALQAICKEYHQRIVKLEDAKYDLEYAVRQKEFVINELNMQVNDMRGKFIKPPLKKVSRFEYGKFEKLMRAAKRADNDFRANLKSVGPSTKFKLEDEPKEAKPDWALGAKKEQAEE